MTAQMGRGSVIFGFWLVGYALGFVAYFVALPMMEGLGFLFRTMSSDVVGGMVSGLAGSLISLAILYVWSHSGSRS
ncbi:MAG: hypothetical protein PXY39_06905 [archaeon]|jgi:hypothetical protein|nr:hypothetical protein [archaeon]